MSKSQTSKNHRTERKRWLTIPAPSPIVPENVNRTLTIGRNHFINFLSRLQKLLKASACIWSTFEKASGLSQPTSFAAKVCVSRDFPVTFWYSLLATSKIAVKWCEGPAVWLFVDIRGALTAKYGGAVVNEGILTSLCQSTRHGVYSRAPHSHVQRSAATGPAKATVASKRTDSLLT